MDLLVAASLRLEWVLVERLVVALATPLVLELVVDLMLMWLPVLALVVVLVVFAGVGACMDGCMMDGRVYVRVGMCVCGVMSVCTGGCMGAHG